MKPDNTDNPVNLDELAEIIRAEIEETSLDEFIENHLVRDPDDPFGRPELSEAPARPNRKPVTVQTINRKDEYA